MKTIKRALTIVLILLVFLPPLFCWNKDEQESATIFGIMGKVAEFVVSLNYDAEYAFKLDEEDNPLASFIELDPNLTNRTGLRVANWGFLCNTPATVTIAHDMLTSEFDTKKKIEYELGVQTSTNTFDFILSTNTLTLSYPMTNNEPIHFDNYGLFVRLVSYLSDLRDYPVGYYYSTISFTATTIN